MKLLEGFCKFIDWRMTTPTNMGWFHLMFIGIAIAITTILCVFFRNANDKTFRRISLIAWIIILALEITKQIYFSYHVDTDTLAVSWGYQWYAFPYQFCSSPLYVLPIVVFMKDGKIRDSAISFMSLFVLFAGLSVFAYATQVFTSSVFINIQTMVHHGSQVVLGIYYIAYYRKKFNILYFLKSLPTFAAMALGAIVLDEFVPLFVDGTFNMWFISRHYPCTLPILSMIYGVVPYPIFLITYFLGFSLVSFIVNMAAVGIIKLTNKKKAH